MSKTICTITCHRVFNHGASLQQFALLSYLKDQGYNVKNINYQPPYLADNYRYFGVPSQRFQKNLILRAFYIFAKFPERFSARKRRAAFDYFEQKYIPQTSRLYRTNEELKKDLPSADIFICGSDQIWNTLFENGKDPAFYLDFVPAGKRKMSYAASFATEKIAAGCRSFVRENIAKLDHVSVREISGIQIIEGLGLEAPVHVLDPVFLLSPTEWEQKFNLENSTDSPYVLVYDFDRDPLIAKCASYLKERKGYQIFALSNRIKYADRTFWSIGPAEFLKLIHGATYVLANSFHATAFSFIFKKNFLIFNRSTGINTRMRDFLREFGLLTRLVSDFNPDVIETPVHFSEVDAALEEKVNKSKLFLNTALQ